MIFGELCIVYILTRRQIPRSNITWLNEAGTEAYSKPSQTSKIETSKIEASKMFDWVLNTPVSKTFLVHSEIFLLQYFSSKKCIFCLNAFQASATLPHPMKI